MKFNHKIYITLLLVFILFISNTKNCTAKVIEQVYTIYDSNKADLSELIDEHIKMHGYNVYKSSKQGGFYFVQPKFMKKYSENYYLLINLKQINKDNCLYMQSNLYSSQVQKTLIADLKTHNYNPVQVKGLNLIRLFRQNNAVILNPFGQLEHKSEPDYLIGKYEKLDLESSAEVKVANKRPRIFMKIYLFPFGHIFTDLFN